MKSQLVFTILAFAITGLLAPSVVSDVYSEKGGNDKAQGTPSGCDNGKGKDITQNPNCGDGTTPPTTDTDRDGIPDVDDACPLFANTHYIGDEPDHDNDGTIDKRDKTPCPVDV